MEQTTTDLVVENLEDAGIRFYTNLEQRMTITKSDNNEAAIGIGTNSPIAPLHIHSGEENGHFRLQNNSSGSLWDDGTTIAVELNSNDLPLNLTKPFS